MSSETFDKKEKISLQVSGEAEIPPPPPVGLKDTDMPDFGGRFDVIERIGEGGMGVVYKVLDPALEKVFAVKVLRPLLAADKQALRRFRKEAEAAIRLTHPGLVAVYEHHTLADGTPYLVMDYVEGENLADVIVSNGKIQEERALRIFDQVVEALEHVHEAGLVHRDVKPRNIILSKNESGEETIKLVDFGIARDASPDGATTSGVTQTGDFLGSPLYMSPEQCQAAELEPRSDIYSAGCVLYEMLTAQTPFASPNPVKIVVGHLSEKPVPPSGLVQEKTALTAELDMMVLKCLEKSPSKRYQSAKELRQDLAECLENKSPFGDRKRQSRKSMGIVIVLVVFLVVWAIASVVSPMPLEFFWYASDTLRPYSIPLFFISTAAFVALNASFASRPKQPQVTGPAVIPWAVSYAIMICSYLILPRVPLEAGLLAPYAAASLAALGASVFYGLKYSAIKKQILFAPHLMSSGRSLTEEEEAQLSLWRKLIASTAIFGALFFKAPEFVPLIQVGPILGAFFALAMFLFGTHRIQLRLSKPDRIKPGDRWLLLSGIAASTAIVGYASSLIISYLASIFMLTSSFASGAGAVAAVFTFAPMLVSLVFLAVWAARRDSPAPFGKSDGW